MGVTHVIVRMRVDYYSVDSPLKVSTRYRYPALSYTPLDYVAINSYDSYFTCITLITLVVY